MNSPDPPLVMHLVHSLEGGGTERVLVALLRGFDHRTMRHTVVTQRSAGSLAVQLPDRVGCIALGTRGRSWSAGLRIARACRRLRPAILHARNVNTWADAMLARLRRAAAEAEGKVADDPCATVDAYFAAVRAKDLEAWLSLFAEDATYTLPNGNVYEGKAAIHQIQQAVFASGAPFPTPTGRITGSEGIAVEVEAALPDGTVRRTTNIYRFNEDGKIRSLGVYMRSA